ncbi:MAG: ArsC family (seleno)protein [Planctomycetota bacterium]
MPKVDWSYHRNGCKTCGKTAAFLAEHKIAVAAQDDARKTPLVETDALKLVSQANDLYVTRGTKVIHIDVKRERPDDETLLGLLIGPSGKLRAPTIKLGKTLVVGFDQATYEKVFAK